MVLWSSHLTAFDDFGNGMKMLFQSCVIHKVRRKFLIVVDYLD